MYLLLYFKMIIYCLQRKPEPDFYARTHQTLVNLEHIKLWSIWNTSNSGQFGTHQTLVNLITVYNTFFNFENHVPRIEETWLRKI